MSEQPTVCKVCKQPLDAHRMQLRWGTVHVGIEVDGRFRSCTELMAEYSYNAGRRDALSSLVRSLRWHAGRMRTQGTTWTADDLDERANKAVKEIETLLGHVDLYYSWAKKD